MKTYLGLKENSQPTIFEDENEPSKATHPQYDVIYGPFKNRDDAANYVKALNRGVACSEVS